MIFCISTLDCDILHLLRTTEKLQDQLEVMDQRCETSKKSALALLKSGHKKVALRHIRELKLTTESREKCVCRVEEVLNTISDSESTKMVSEAIKTGTKAMKNIKINADEVHECLEEIDEMVESQKQIEKALESAPYSDIDDEDIEEEFLKLEMELEESESSQVISETTNSITEMFLELRVNSTKETSEEQEDTTKPALMKKDSGKKILEAA